MKKKHALWLAQLLDTKPFLWSTVPLTTYAVRASCLPDLVESLWVYAANGFEEPPVLKESLQIKIDSDGTIIVR